MNAKTGVVIEELRDLWFAPLFWPIAILIASGDWTYRWHWSADLLLFSVCAPVALILTPVMLIPQLIIVLILPFAALFVLIYRLMRYRTILENGD